MRSISFASAVLVALLSIGCNSNSDDSGTPVEPPKEGPAPPTRVNAYSDDGALHVWWSAAANATSYNVYYAPKEGVTKENYESLGGGKVEEALAGQTIEGLAADTIYWITVTSIGDDAEGAGTPPVRVTNLSRSFPSGEFGWLSAREDAGRFGWAVAGGLMNDDRYADLVVSAPFEDAGNPRQGQVFVFNGSQDGPADRADWFTQGQGSSDVYFGASVATADLDNDGLDELLVGAPGTDSAAINTGAVYVYTRRCPSCPLSTDASLVVDGAFEEARLGTSLAVLGDADGDGYVEVAMGAPGSQDVTARPGYVSVYAGSPTGISSSPYLTVEGQPGGEYGFSVSPAGDVNGDGFADMMVVSRTHTGTWVLDQGKAFLYLGGYNGINEIASWTFLGNEIERGLDRAAGAGDVNGDGYGDVLVSTYHWDAGNNPGAGRVYVFLGGASGLSKAPQLTLTGSHKNELFGYSIEGVGDMNNDGFGDVLVGSPGYGPGSAVGRAQVLEGSVDGLTVTAGWEVVNKRNDSREAGDRFGNAVSRVGDLNGDGANDMIVGAWEYDKVAYADGAAMAFYGRPHASPKANAGEGIAGLAKLDIEPGKAVFEQLGFAPARCTWEWGDASSPDVIDDCTPENFAAVTHVYQAADTFWVRLTVETRTGVIAESLTQATIKP